MSHVDLALTSDAWWIKTNITMLLRTKKPDTALVGCISYPRAEHSRRMEQNAAACLEYEGSTGCALLWCMARFSNRAIS